MATGNELAVERVRKGSTWRTFAGSPSRVERAAVKGARGQSVENERPRLTKTETNDYGGERGESQRAERDDKTSIFELTVWLGRVHCRKREED